MSVLICTTSFVSKQKEAQMEVFYFTGPCGETAIVKAEDESRAIAITKANLPEYAHLADDWFFGRLRKVSLDEPGYIFLQFPGTKI